MVPSNRSINDLTLLKRKENARDYDDEYVARTQQECRTIIRSQQVRHIKEQPFEGIEEYNYAVDPRTGWRFSEQQQGDLSLSSPFVHRTLLLTRICINSGLNITKTNYKNPLDVPRKPGYVLQNIDCYRSISRIGLSHEESVLYTQAHPCI